ncbi:tetratricopeptide repeat protein [Streptomyces sp. NPDC088350]|uniref:tetratricopeptide repeat protein n=1 Tax=Streptomyces sp. NPDC088350 TaxID=3365854 RepID=UPI0037F32229
MALSIHTAIPLPADADPSLSGTLPHYIPRGIDADVRAWIRGHTETGGLLVLVGDAAAGKTRCLYEALRAEVPDWRIPEVETGAQLNTLVREGVALSRSVIWLDELQNFFADEMLTAASVRQLLLGRYGPVLLAATIRTEELDRLAFSASPTVGGSATLAYNHAQQVIKMVARWSPRGGVAERAIRFHVAGQLTPDELARARVLAESDPRIRIALRGAEDGQITATLAGAPELIDRWTLDTAGNPSGQAVITAAVVARRCGHPEPIPLTVLETLALLHLAGQEAVPPTAEWLTTAVAWAENPVTGRIRALRRSATVPGTADGYRVSDVLLQHSYVSTQNPVDSLLVRDDVWTALLEHAAPFVLTDIGLAADAAGKVELAVRAWRGAAHDEDRRAMSCLGRFHADLGEIREGASWFRRAIDLGYRPAMVGLAGCLRELGERAEAETWVRRAAELGSTGAMVYLGMMLFAEGNAVEGEAWYRRAAELGEVVVMANLGYQLKGRGDLAGAEEWNRRGAVLGVPGAMENLAVILNERGDHEQALEWYRRAAERSLAFMEESPSFFRPWPGESRDQGVSESILGLVRMLLAQVGTDQAREEAEYWLRVIAERGDARAAAALSELAAERGDTAGARAWRRTAAEASDSLLTRSWSSLLDAYGEPGVRCHVDILLTHATRLAQEGDATGAEEWHTKAAHHATRLT